MQDNTQPNDKAFPAYDAAAADLHFAQDDATSNQLLSLQDLWEKLLRNWYLILLFEVVCLGIGFLYVKSTPKTYERSAMILVKGDNEKNSIVSELTQFTNGRSTLLRSKSDVENELIILRTERVVAATVRELNLDVNYYARQGLRKVNVYKSAPVQVYFTNNVDSTDLIKFQIKPDGAQGYRITDLESAKKGTLKGTIKGSYGDTVKTPVGNLVVIANPTDTGFDELGSIKVEKRSLSATVRGYMNALNADLASKQSAIIKLSIQAGNYRLAEDFLNTLVKIYTQFGQDDKLAIARSTERFIDDRLAIISRELGDVDDQIETFKQDNGVADIDVAASQFIKTTDELNRNLVDVNNRLQMARYVRDYITNPGNKFELVPSGVGLEDPIASTQIANYNQLLLKRKELVVSSGETNPLLETTNAQLDAMRTSLKKSIDNLINSLTIQLNALNREDALNKKNIASVPTQEKIVGRIYRQQSIKEQLYLFLLNVREKNAISMEATESDIRFIQPATGPLSPVAPKTMLIALAAFLLGLLLPMGILYLQLILDDKIRGRKDLDPYKHIPFLGEVPHMSTGGDLIKRGKTLLSSFGMGKKNKIKHQSRVNLVFAVEENNRSLLTESFSVIRTNLSFMEGGRSDLQTIMVASMIPSSGKSFVSSNLALSLCKSGKRVLLIDSDIRRTSLSNAIREKVHFRSPGLTGYLSDPSLAASQVILTQGFPGGLHFIPAGAVPPNPSELLLSKRLDQLKEEVREHYDYIVIDTAPFMTMADARISNRIADTTIIVIREGLLPRKLMSEVELAYRKNYFRGIALVLNDAGISDSSRTYGYYGKYGYYKSYSYYGSYGNSEQ